MLWIDALIVAIYFVVITTIGLRMSRRENSLRDFALGGRGMPWWAVMASIIAAETSAATFLGAPGEGYEKKSLAYVQLVIGVIIGRVIVGFVFLKPYFVYKVYTVYDYLGIRFGPMSRRYVSALFLFMRTLASGTRLFVPSLLIVLAWKMLRGTNSSPGVGEYVIAIALLTAITCVYTAIGGIKAVIWTDVIQATLMFGSAIVAIVTLLHGVGGFKSVAEFVPAMSSLRGYFMTGFESHPADSNFLRVILGSDYTIFSAIIATTLSTMAYFGTDQDMVQRMLTAETYIKSRRSLIAAALMDVPIAAAFTFIGILLFVFYSQRPDQKPASSADVFANYILHEMPPIVRGFVLAGVLATAMGSLSAALNALATSATNDWYLPIFPRRNDSHYVLAARIFTAIFALLMILIAGFFAFAKVKDPGVRIIPVVLGIGGFIVGPMLGVFLIGMLTTRRGSDIGNLIAISIGLCTTIYLGGLHVELLKLFGVQNADRFAPPIKIAFTWFAMIGAIAVFAVGVLFRSPMTTIENARRVAERAATDDRPLALRV